MRLGHSPPHGQARRPPPRRCIRRHYAHRRDAAPRRRASRGLRLRLLALRPDRRARRPGLVRDLRDRHRVRPRRRARADARRSRGGRIPEREDVWRFRIRPGLRFQSGDACDAEAVADALRLHGDPVEAPINAVLLAERRRRARRGRRGARRAARAERGDAAAAPLVALGDPQPGGAGARPATSSAARPPTARARSAFVESVSGSHLDVARWDGWRGRTHDVGGERAGRRTSTAIRWIPILDDRERAAALERGEIDCIQNASLLDVDRLAANPDIEVIEFQQSALVYMGLDCRRSRSGGDVRVRRAVSLAIDRQALVERDLERPRLAGVLADPVALAVVRARGRGVAALRPARGAGAARRGRLRARRRRRPARARDGGRERRDRAARRRDDRASCSPRSASGSSSR